MAILICKIIPLRHISTVRDPNGRFILLTGYIYSFFSKTFNLLVKPSHTRMIIGGDFNCVLGSYLDGSAQTTQSPFAASSVVNNLISFMDLMDIWRLQHPTIRDYSFISQIHKSYSSIDYSLLDSSLISTTISATYHNIFISDHSPVSLVLNFHQRKQQFSGRFNPSLLSYQKFNQFISSKINEFLEVNDNSEVTDSTLWEAFKAVIREHIISF